MKLFNCLVCISLSLVSPLVISARELTQAQELMINDLQSAKNTMSAKYAPTDWKNELFGWNIIQAYELAKTRVIQENPKSDRDYQKIFLKFIQSTQDYHVRATFYSSEMSWFPLKMKGVNGRYYVQSFIESSLENIQSDGVFGVDEIDYDKYFSNWPKIMPGDEILLFNGKAVGLVIEQIIDEDLDGDRSPTGYSLAEQTLFLKRGQYGQVPFLGEFELRIKHKASQEVACYSLPWIHLPEFVDSQFYSDRSQKELKGLFKSRSHKADLLHSLSNSLSKDYSVAFARGLVDMNMNKMLKGMKREFATKDLVLNDRQNVIKKFDQESDDGSDFRVKNSLPPIGKVIWETDKDRDFYAYLAENKEGLKIGYIYLPSFGYDANQAEYLIGELIEIIQFFEEESQGLVVDISNNPGGSLFYMYAVLSTLTDTPLKTPTSREKIIQEDIFYNAIYKAQTKALIKELEEVSDQQYSYDTIHGFVLNMDVLNNISVYLEFISDSWKRGELLTEPYHLSGIQEISPHPEASYSKPMIVLINELDFSCGDIFPAILQDNRRATLFGTKTAGAGGYVRGYGQTSQFGIQGYSLTGSIIYRLDGTPIENLGVSPDVVCEITERDLQENYVDYVERLNSEINRLIN